MAADNQPKTPAEAAVAKEVAPRPTRNWRARFFQGYLITAVIAFGVLVVLASQFDYFPVDLAITREVQFFTPGWFVILMGAVSYIGYNPQSWIMVAALAGLLFVFGLRWEGVMSAVAAIGAALFVQAIKIVVRRPRPSLDLVQVAAELNSYSFPSGHVVFYVAFFGFLFFLIFTLFKPSAGRLVLLVFCGAMVALVGLSRIYLGNHWASDVTGAYLFGSIWLAACVSLYRWGKPRFFVQQPVAPAETVPATVKHS